MMDRHEQAGVTLDTCAACRGVWYDMGEIARVYQLPPLPQGLAASTVDEHAMDDAPPAWLLALDIVLSLVGAFIPMPFRIGRL